MFTDVPYSNRKLIIVVDRDFDKVEKLAEKRRFDIKKVRPQLMNLPDRIKKIRDQYKKKNISAFESIKVPYNEFIKLYYENILDLNSHDVNIQVFCRNEVKNIKFPPGHPRDLIVYVGHPLVWENYYPIADFHRSIFEHKFSEVLHLLMSLGASELEVVRIEGYSSEFAAKIGLETSIQSISAGYERDSQKKVSREALFKARFDHNVEPEIPPDLTWYHYEPTWKNIAEGRTKFGLKDFSLDLRYRDDYGVNQSLRMKISKAGLNVGGSFQEHMSTEWKISGKFK